MKINGVLFLIFLCVFVSNITYVAAEDKIIKKYGKGFLEEMNHNEDDLECQEYLSEIKQNLEVECQ